MFIPAGLTLGEDGSLYVADRGNHRVRQILIDPVQGKARSIRTVAGNGFQGILPGVNPAAGTSLSQPISLAAATGGLFIVEREGPEGQEVGSIRFLDQETGLIGDILERPPELPSAVALQAGSLFLSDEGTGEVLKVVLPASDLLVLGTGPVERLATLDRPGALALLPQSGSQTIFVAELGSGLVRVLRDGTLQVAPFAGGGTLRPAQDRELILQDGSPVKVRLGEPRGLAASSAHLFISDGGDANVEDDDAVLAIDLASSKVVNVITGLSFPTGLAVDGAGILYVSESGTDAPREGPPGNRVVKIVDPHLPAQATLESFAANNALKEVSQNLAGVRNILDTLKVSQKNEEG